MIVNEIFKSIDGEGKRTGQLATFIRLAGCNLRCIYCDTEYALKENQGTEMAIIDIINDCNDLGVKNITLTGGEPLIHKDVDFLIKALAQAGFKVSIETNGSVDLRPFIELRNRFDLDVSFVVDYKTKYSLMKSRMNYNSFAYLDINKDIVKCVVASEDDMNDALEYLDSFGKKFNIWFSPVFNQIEPKEIVEYVKEHNREDITIQVQLHKIIWEPTTKGV